MNERHVGSRARDHVREMEKAPAFRKAMAEHIEKARVGMLVRQLREREHLTQAELAERVGVTQSVIARIEGSEPRALPRLDLLNRIAETLGYHTVISMTKGNRALRVALSNSVS